MTMLVGAEFHAGHGTHFLIMIDGIKRVTVTFLTNQKKINVKL